MKKQTLRMAMGLLGLSLLSCGCMSANKVYLVRHAEKASQTAANPELSPEGITRAEELSRVLRHKHIGFIYATKYIRSQQTASPLASLTHLPITVYSPDTTATIIKNAFKQKKSSLIIGHSNTLLPLLKAAGLHPSMHEISDEQYDLLFAVYIRKGKLFLEERRYGKPLPNKN